VLNVPPSELERDSFRNDENYVWNIWSSDEASQSLNVLNVEVSDSDIDGGHSFMVLDDSWDTIREEERTRIN